MQPKTPMKKLTLSASILALFAAMTLPAQAQSLVELYESARAFDAAYQSAKSQYEANQFRADQARAQTLPSVGLSAEM